MQTIIRAFQNNAVIKFFVAIYTLMLWSEWKQTGSYLLLWSKRIVICHNVFRKVLIRDRMYDIMTSRRGSRNFRQGGPTFLKFLNRKKMGGGGGRRRGNERKWRVVVVLSLLQTYGLNRVSRLGVGGMLGFLYNCNPLSTKHAYYMVVCVGEGGGGGSGGPPTEVFFGLNDVILDKKNKGLEVNWIREKYTKSMTVPYWTLTMEVCINAIYLHNTGERSEPEKKLIIIR